MIASALKEMAQLYFEQGRALHVPGTIPVEDAAADHIERMPFSI
jgi:hypothetical protein